MPLFRNLDAEAVATVAAHAKLVQIGAGHALFRQGEPARLFFVLLRGRVKITQVSAEGHEVILRVIARGEPLGGVAAVWETPVYPVTARAIEPCEAHAWDGPRMTALMLRFPAIALNAARLMATRLHELQRRHRELMTDRVKQRLARALLRLARDAGRRVEGGVAIDFPLSRQDLAQMTGTTLFTVSRTLREWESDGLIRSGRRRLVVCRPRSLLRIAEDPAV